jgi:PIN domain nuclease of toxin-antitoxin system
VGGHAIDLLLDTHIWIWSVLEERRLAPFVRSALSDEQNDRWLSPISVWELLLLAERGRFHIEPGLTPREWVSLAMSRAPVREASLVHEVALRSREVILEHDDPADRFLAATASVYGLTLVTADERLLRGRGFQTLPNR